MEAFPPQLWTEHNFWRSNHQLTESSILKKAVTYKQLKLGSNKTLQPRWIIIHSMIAGTHTLVTKKDHYFFMTNHEELWKSQDVSIKHVYYYSCIDYSPPLACKRRIWWGKKQPQGGCHGMLQSSARCHTQILHISGIRTEPCKSNQAKTHNEDNDGHNWLSRREAKTGTTLKTDWLQASKFWPTSIP